MLPDDIFLEIFDFYVDEDMDDFESLGKQIIEEWITLAHVCQRWRRVVLQSPHRLNLRLLCTPTTRARNILDIWPPLPLVICNDPNINSVEPTSVDNIVAALEHNDRVRYINLKFPSSSVLNSVAIMQRPFPELTDLWLEMYETGPILSDSFLDGTTPRLRLIILENVPFPGLPKLLLSAAHIVTLHLFRIPPSGYISPVTMANSLSALTSLESLCLSFRCPPPRPAQESRHTPPLIRSNLPNLTKITFNGTSEYLEEILARIDAHRLDELYIFFFNQITFDTPQLFQFISRRPKLRAREKGRILFNHKAIRVAFPPQTSYGGVLNVEVSCTVSEWQLSSLEQVCSSSLPPVSALEDLYIYEDRLEELPLHWQDDVENTLWLELLHPFGAVKNLYLCKTFVPRIAPALQELVGGRTTEVLPTLENIFMEGLQPSGPLQEGIQKFVAARQLTNRPVTVSLWDKSDRF